MPDPIISTGGTATGSAEPNASENAAKAFDGDVNTKFLTFCPNASAPSSSTNPGGAWLRYQFAGGTAFRVTEYQLRSANDASLRDPKDWRLQGSNDGSAWATVHTVTNDGGWASRLAARNFTPSTATNAYSYYRLLVDQNQGSQETGLGGFGMIQLSEMVLYGLPVTASYSLPARSWNANAQARMDGPSVRLAVFVEFDFVGGAVRVCNCSHDVSWNGFTWNGLGNLGAIDEVKEDGNVDAKGLAFALSGVPSGYLASVFNQQYQGRRATMWVAPLMDDGTFADVRQVYEGRMDTMPIIDGQNSVVQVNTENELADLFRPRVRRYTDSDLQAAYPGDLGLEYVEYLAQERSIRWGQA